MNLDPLLRLADDWRADAERLREYGAKGQARACEKHAEELENRLRHWEMEALSVAEAAEESGYTTRHVRRLIEDGTLPNAGDSSSPKVRRRDLPRKPGNRRPGGRSSGRASASRSRVARTVMESD